MFFTFVSFVFFQSMLNDENYPVWYHSQCFLEIQKDVHIRQIQNFENIIYEHQLEIILKTNFDKSEKKRIFRKRKGDEKVSCDNYAVEYSISDHECIKCSKKIEARTLHMRMFENDRKTSLDLYVHYSCFFNNRLELGFVWGGEHLQGFESLPQEDQKMTKSCLP